MRLLVTRPEPDATELADALRHRQHEVIVSPLLDISFVRPDIKRLDGYAGLIVTSRNALRAIAENAAFTNMKRCPVYCVGPGTERLARGLGFDQTIGGSGNADDLARQMIDTIAPEGGPLLRLAGDLPLKEPSDLAATLVAAGFDVHETTVYRISPRRKLSEPARAAILSSGLDGVLLMSPLTAKTFLQCLDTDELARSSTRLLYFCLSNAVAGRLTDIPDDRIWIADKPNRTELLSIVDRVVAQLP